MHTYFPAMITSMSCFIQLYVFNWSTEYNLRFVTTNIIFSKEENTQFKFTDAISFLLFNKVSEVILHLNVSNLSQDVKSKCKQFEKFIFILLKYPYLNFTKIFKKINSSPVENFLHDFILAEIFFSSNASFLTLYNLELPAPKTVFNDISIVANVHRFSSALTYCHLMSEAHMVLRMSLLLKKWCPTDDNVKLLIHKKSNVEDLIDIYRTSCALLADHYIM